MLPPSLALLVLAVAVPLGLFAPGLGPLARSWRIAGFMPLGFGLWLVASARGLLVEHQTTLGTFDHPDALVASGPFAWSRNPIYLGMVLALAGVALFVGSLTAWLAPLGFGLAADRWYIAIEERQMLAAFGGQYDVYRTRVPRWFGRVRRRRPAAS